MAPLYAAKRSFRTAVVRNLLFAAAYLSYWMSRERRYSTKRRDGCTNCFRVFRYVKLGKNLTYDAGLIDQKRCALDTHIFATHKALELPDSVKFAYRVIRIRKDRERQAVFVHELRLLLHGIRAYAEDD